jgi:transposase
LGGKARSQQFNNLRQQALHLHIEGVNNTKIAEYLNVSRKTITRWLNQVVIQ